jgi:hypothetical protein
MLRESVSRKGAYGLEDIYIVAKARFAYRGLRLLGVLGYKPPLYKRLNPSFVRSYLDLEA